MRATTAVLAVVAVATAGFAAVVVAQQEPRIELGSSGIQLVDAPTPVEPETTLPAETEVPVSTSDGESGAPGGLSVVDSALSTPSPTDPAASTAPAEPTEPTEPETAPAPVETVEPAPVRTMPPQAAQGKPEEPGKSGENSSKP